MKKNAEFLVADSFIIECCVCNASFFGSGLHVWREQVMHRLQVCLQCFRTRNSPWRQCQTSRASLYHPWLPSVVHAILPLAHTSIARLASRSQAAVVTSGWVATCGARLSLALAQASRSRRCTRQAPDVVALCVHPTCPQ